MTATFTLTGDLEPLVGNAVKRSVYARLSQPVTDATNDVTYDVASRATADGTFKLVLPAKNALNNGGADFEIVVTIAGRQWLVPAQNAGTIHDLSEFTEITGFTPVPPSQFAQIQAYADAAIIAATGTRGLALDTDGVPYFDASIVSNPTLAVHADTDGAPYFEGA